MVWHRCFPVNFVKFLRTPFFTEHLWCLLLAVKNEVNGRLGNGQVQNSEISEIFFRDF